MRILITGGTGMVGRNIKESNLAKSHTILAPNRQELDLTDKLKVRQWLIAKSPEYIIHAAGLVGGIHANIANPSKFLISNLEIGCILISEAAEIGIKNIINLGSSCMYPRNISNPLKEEFLLQGELEPTNEGYALAKIAAQRLCDYLVKEDPSRNYLTLMPCNLYGRYDNFNANRSHLIASIIVKLHEAKVHNIPEVIVWGDGSAKREFMHVDDLVSSIWCLLPLIEELPNIMNVGIGQDHTILEYYKEAAKVIGYEGRFSFDLSKPIGMKQKLLNVKKINSFGWAPRVTLKEGLTITYNHYLEFVNKSIHNAI